VPDQFSGTPAARQRETRPSRGEPGHAALTIDCFETCAKNLPDAPALELDGERLSYGEVNRRANRLARRLRALGAGRDVLVALCFDRSFELVIAVIAVLKAGAAYLPLDPGDPPGRLTFVLEDARAPLVVTRSRFAPSLTLPPGARACVVDDPNEAREIEGQDDSDPSYPIAPDHLAYAIFTSGSSGRPKGVLVTHRNLDRLFRTTEALFDFGPEDVWTLFHSYTFDFSVWELWGALRHGARLVIVPRGVARSPDAFHELLARTGTTVLNQTPSAFRQLSAQDASAGHLPSLRLVVLGGEALEPAMLASWFARHGDDRPRLVNMYGITETTVHATYRPMTREDLFRPAVSVIGRPIADLQIWILDAQGNPCPPGVAGEIHVAGPGVAQGYLRRPELTRERFVPNPFAHPGDADSGRMYRSGDLGRFRADGDIEYLGRADQQVKIRGHRIEPAEVESALRQHAAIRDAAVVAREDGAGDQRLVAYVVGTSAPLPAGSDLRAFLRRTLPDAMVPAEIVALDALPLTSNGKLDRGALPPPLPENVLRESGSPPPDDPDQAVLAEIWSDTLGIRPVGASDDFFALGGDSLRAARVMARVRDAFGVELALGAMFECRTIVRLAAKIQSARGSETGSLKRPGIVPLSRRVTSAGPPAPGCAPPKREH
jgi:amino acid adenylation domain-containing protein